MRTVVFAAMLATACTSHDAADSVDAAPEPTIDAASAGTPNAIARGQLWVDAMVPYCQAINHAADADTSCAATCTRPDNPAWDPYRSDCSGFVSWSWGLPSLYGGRTTAEFAPFDTDITHVIAAADLAPGDAVNNSEHMMLFVAWVTPANVGTMATFMEEPGCSSATPYAHEFTTAVTSSDNTVTLPDSAGTFTAIRLNQPVPPP